MLKSGPYGHHLRLGFLLCDAFPGLYSWLLLLLFVGLSAFSFVLSKWNTCSIRLISGDWLGHCRIFHFLSSKTLAFTLHFGSSSICTMKCRPINFAESISLYTSESNRLLLYSVISSLNTSNSVPQEAMHAHAFTLLHHVSQMMLYALDHELFQAFSKSFFCDLLFSTKISTFIW